MEKKWRKEWRIWWKGIKYISLRRTLSYANTHSFNRMDKISVVLKDLLYPFISEEWVEK